MRPRATVLIPLENAEIQIGGALSTSAQPAVAADRLGNMVMIWRGASAGAITLLRQRYDSAGQPIGSPQALAGTGTDPLGPQVGFDGAGRSTVIWNDQDSFRLDGRRYDANGQPLGAVFTIATFGRSPSTAALTVLPDGTFIAAWKDPVSGVLAARHLAANGIPLGATVTVSTANRIETIDIVGRSDGRFAARWTQVLDSIPTTIGTFIRFYDNQGQPASEALQLGVAPRPKVPAQAGGLSADEGEVLVAYAEGEAIMVERFIWSGASPGPALLVSATPDRLEHSPSVVRVVTGEIFVAWVREGPFRLTEPFARLYGRWLESSGQAFGTAFWMSPSLAAANSSVALAEDGLGTTVAVYHQTPSLLTSVGSLHGRRLRPDMRAGTLRLQPATAQRFEGATLAPITAVRSGGSAGRVAVRYSLAGDTATPHDDFVSQDGVITFEDGETGAKSAAVELRDDPEVEPDETFTGTLANATGGAELIGPATASITIVDDDFAAVGMPPTSPLPPFTLNPASPAVHHAPAVASHASGMHAVAWRERDPFTGIHTVYARRFDHQGQPLGDGIALGTMEIPDKLAFLDSRPALAFDASGGFLVAWGVGTLQARYVDATGVPAAAAFTIDTSLCLGPSLPTCSTTPHQPSVIAVSADAFTVMWNDRPFITAPETSSVSFQRVHRLGGAQADAVPVAFGAFDGVATGYEDGSFIVVWEPFDLNGLRAQRFDAQGIALHPPIALQGSSSDSTASPSAGWYA